MKNKILLVEDETITALFHSSILNLHGYEVILAYTGEDAVEKALTDNEISMILMDIDLGRGINGFQAAKTILKNRIIPILFLTNYIDPDITKKTENILYYGYITKNSDKTFLIASIMAAFNLYDVHIDLFKENKKLESINKVLVSTIEQYKLTD